MTKNIQGKIFIWIFIVLFPILPSYTRIQGYAAYSWLAIITFLLIILLNAKKFMKISKSFFLVSLCVFLLYFLSFFVNGEFDRILYEIIEVGIPLSFLCFTFKRFNQTDFEKVINLLVYTSSILCVFGLIEFSLDLMFSQ